MQEESLEPYAYQMTGKINSVRLNNKKMSQRRRVLNTNVYSRLTNFIKIQKSTDVAYHINRMKN